MTLAVIGGSGLYAMAGVEVLERCAVDTPYGPPSDDVVRARAGAAEMLFLPRHGRGHRIPPHRINYRANICALKKLGATQLVSVGACGSLREAIAPGDIVLVDQFIDLTKRRVSTFFERMVAHVGFADPVCAQLVDALEAAAERLTGVKVHRGGTYVCMEGPQFSTRAESQLYRSWGADLIGMTAMPEAKLAREAQLPYALIGLATDYDCWHDSEDDVDVEAVIARLGEMLEHAQALIMALTEGLPDPAMSPASEALANALMTAPAQRAAAARELAWLLPQS